MVDDAGLDVGQVQEVEVEKAGRKGVLEGLDEHGRKVGHKGLLVRGLAGVDEGNVRKVLGCDVLDRRVV